MTSLQRPVRVRFSDEAASITVPDHSMAVSAATVLAARRKGLRVTLIAAADTGWGIGKEGGLPWRSPEDLRHFRNRTMGRHLVMGRNTHDGLPKKLDGRTIHVVSSASSEGLTSVHEALAKLAKVATEELLVVGGGRVYADALPFCTHAEVTRIPGTHECDAHMPDLAHAGWRLVDTKPLTETIHIEYWEASDGH